ncbi:MAG: M23 family metallopeptidase [Eubacteriaceae bacterium]|nr:M23 family metallopeptidase [Eubacteriaceae bacterium]
MKRKNEKYTALLAGLLTLTAIAGTFIAAESIRDSRAGEDIIQGGNDIIPNQPGIEDFEDLLPNEPSENTNDPELESNTEVTPPTEEKKPVAVSAEKPSQVIGEDETVSVSVDGFDIGKAVWPVSSKVITYDYSYKTSPVYSVTFKEYRSDHNGVDIRADLGENVKCVYEGKVSQITKDAKLGNTVTIDHGNSIISIYANLSEDIKVTVGEKVGAGKVLATVGSSAAYELADEPHLHFGVKAFGDYVNPMDYINN